MADQGNGLDASFAQKFASKVDDDIESLDTLEGAKKEFYEIYVEPYKKREEEFNVNIELMAHDLNKSIENLKSQDSDM